MYQLCCIKCGKMTLQLKEYRRNLSKKSEENIFLLPWGGVVCRNCDDLGDLISYKSVADYKEGDKPLWLVLSLVLFRENVSLLLDKFSIQLLSLFLYQGNIFSIFSCNSCSSMESVPGMRLEQGKDEILGLQCVHSKAAETFFPNWDEHWIVNDLEDTDLSYRVVCNPDIQVQTFMDVCRFLSAIQTDGHVTLLFTVGKRL